MSNETITYLAARCDEQEARIAALEEELRKAVRAGQYVVQICEQDVRDGESESPHVKSCPSAVMAHCYAAMNFVTSAREVLDT